MNLDEITRLLQITLRGFCIHEKFIDELAYILRSSGIERSFFKKLEFCLRFLSLYGAQAVQHEEFESIGSGIFSMHVDGKGYNVRILYGFLHDQSPALLLAFFERSGKRKTDYQSHIAPAVSRLEMMEVRYGS